MNNKNWNDRADKDLFFTILSVKNIGIITGPEWSTIGNHMRALGYGFTNEGCRQHFQGLRRALNKVEADILAAENARPVDPTLNPITRRPGPGRGRPRKNPVSGTGAPTSTPAPIFRPANPAANPTSTAPKRLASAVPIPVPPPPPPPVRDTTQREVDEQMSKEGNRTLPASATGSHDADGDSDADADVEEHAAKRQRLGGGGAMDDEAVLALAAHNGAAHAYDAE